MKKSFFFTAILAMIVVSILGSGYTLQAADAPNKTPSKTANQPQYGGVLKIAVPAVGMTAMGTPTEIGGQAHTVYPVYETLLNSDVAGNTTGRLAESWKFENNGKSMVLKLRKGVKFSDGTPCDAEAVKWNLSNYLYLGTKIPDLAMIESYDIIDPYTLRLNLTKANVFLPTNFHAFFGQMVSPKAAQIETTPENQARVHMVGTGPFLFSDFKSLTYVKYVKNPNYWQKGKPYLDSIELYLIADPVTRLLAFQKGEFDAIMRITPNDAKTLETAGFVIVPSDSSKIIALFPDGDNKDSPFANKLVRQAVEYAIDKKAIADNIGVGYYAVAHQMLEKNHPGYNAGIAARGYDPKKAKQLLAQAGYPKGFETSLVAPINFNKDTLIVMQSYLQAVGIKATLEIIDAKIATTTSSKGWKGLFVGPQDPMASTHPLLVYLFDPKRRMVSIYHPPGYAEKVAAVEASLDTKTRNAKFKDLMSIATDEAMAIPIYFSPTLHAQSKKVHGLALGKGGYNGLYYEAENAWLSK